MSSFTGKLHSKGYSEKDINNNPVVGRDYNQGWHGLDAAQAKSVEIFKKGNMVIVVKLENHPNELRQVIRVYDKNAAEPNNPIWESSNGEEPPDSVLDLSGD